MPGVRKLAREVGCASGNCRSRIRGTSGLGRPDGKPARSRFVVAAGGARVRRAGVEITTRCGWPAATIPPSICVVRAAGDAVAVVPGPRGSVNGMVQLSRGGADAAALHLLDVASGRWNDPIARGALGGAPVELVHLWRREQGLVVARGNPHGISGVDDLHGPRESRGVRQERGRGSCWSG